MGRVGGAETDWQDHLWTFSTIESRVFGWSVLPCDLQQRGTSLPKLSQLVKMVLNA